MPEGVVKDRTSIHPETALGPVHLTVAELDRSLEFYRGAIGFRMARRETDGAVLSVDGTAPLLLLTEHPGARPKPPRTTGLYHYAILLPQRADLARSLQRLSEVRYPLQGASDHLVSEALYLADPDGNGIEIYADRARERWPRLGDLLQMGTEPLDVDDLLGELAQDGRPWQGLPADTRIGHVHLHVADLDQAEAFYSGVLGFDLMLHYGRSAAFLSAGGYHHHIGLNTWAGVGAPPPPPDAAGLRAFTIQLPDAAEQERVVERVQAAGLTGEYDGEAVFLRDPSGNGIRLAVGAEG